MFELKAAFRFIRKSYFQTLTVLLAVIISIGVEFFILGLGGMLDVMILEQTTSFQDHIILNNYLDQDRYYQNLDFDKRDEVIENDAFKHALFTLEINGQIIKVNNLDITPINLKFIAADNENGNNDYLNYYGLDINKNLEVKDQMPSNDYEIMINKFFAEKNDLNVGDEITYSNSFGVITTYTIINLFDQGIFKQDNNFTYRNIRVDENIESSKYRLNIQIKNPMETDDAIKILSSIFDNENYKFKTWKEIIPEFHVLNLAQNAVILVIELLISVAFFVVVLSVFNFSISQKYKQIGILKAMGHSNKNVSRIFFYQTFILTLIGIILGLLLGRASIYTYGEYMKYPDGTPRFVINLKFIHYLVPFTLIFISSILATLISVIKVQKLEIIELIKI